MFTIIFAGGQGTRISEETNRIPKPMIKVGGKTIIERIMNTYTKHGYNKFIFLTGYKHRKFFNYFKVLIISIKNSSSVIPLLTAT